MRLRSVIPAVLLGLIAAICLMPAVWAESDEFKKLGIETTEATSPLNDFVLPDRAGVAQPLSQWSGRLVLLNFWATWCSPCLLEMPALNRLHEKYAEQGLAVLAINTDPEQRQRIDTVVSRLDLQFPVLLDTDSGLGAHFNVSGLPASYLIDQQNNVIAYIPGARRWDGDNAMRLIEQLLLADNGVTPAKEE